MCTTIEVRERVISISMFPDEPGQPIPKPGSLRYALTHVKLDYGYFVCPKPKTDRTRCNFDERVWADHWSDSFRYDNAGVTPADKRRRVEYEEEEEEDEDEDMCPAPSAARFCGEDEEEEEDDDIR
jgi:hypothetical protein